MHVFQRLEHLYAQTHTIKAAVGSFDPCHRVGPYVCVWESAHSTACTAASIYGQTGVWGRAYLVHDILLMYILQDVCSDDRVQVCLHVLKDEVDVLIILRFVHILEPAYSCFCISGVTPNKEAAECSPSAQASVAQGYAWLVNSIIQACQVRGTVQPCTGMSDSWMPFCLALQCSHHAESWGQGLLDNIVMRCQLLKKHDLPKCSLHPYTALCGTCRVLSFRSAYGMAARS